jgi:RNA polymerase nonessential primary-like sigma factor
VVRIGYTLKKKYMSVKLSGDSVRSYLRDIGRIPLLEHDEEILLGRQVQRMMVLKEMKNELELDNEGLADAMDLPHKQIKKELRDGERAKDKMVTANLRLVVSVAKKYTKRNMELLDIIQEGTIGLVRGVEKFDPGRGYKFSTYAYWWIRQGITRAIAEKSRAIRLPIHITENLNKLKKAQRELSQMNGQMPNVFELAAYMNLTVDDIKDLMCKARQPTSLEIKIGENRDTALIDLLEDETQLPENILETQYVKEDIRELISELPEMQAAVISMRYGIGEEMLEPMSMTAIGQVLNMSRDRVRTLEHKALRSLRAESDQIKEYL